MIDLHLSFRDSTSWVLDTGCASHICNDVQVLTNRRKLSSGKVELRLGNGAKVATPTVGTVNLKLPSGHMLSLNNCLYVPSLIKNIISVSCLDRAGYTLTIRNNCCSLYLGNKVVIYAAMVNG